MAILTPERANYLRKTLSTWHWLSAVQIARQCHVPQDQHPDICKLIVEAVEAGILEHKQDECKGSSVPVFRLRETQPASI